ncbi:MAG: methionine--tRNA ligase [Candidatus Handelsmanbacteria bacterium RIFCSPLOWO2_12_FULL_64_10]|uniref:Methionine--tRNA ligase n=1 Tax=Handelsmanbacteria sp. (strain RIFCSPLOWO2_12_FULL_64_10) TaxID=1817868 RepID=A0A1F6CHX1_HANXR|nr:MAG: methionine--tRNA ligase [Candidatus Handelsmanbacteria bacterium RIFCSPLOWO2_12_FULL_64_10]
MAERILVCVAWPYANGSLHVGQLAGAYLPADIFARFHRLIGDEVLMVSGSDDHGTPTTVRAEQEGRTPQEVTDQYNAEFKESWKQLGIQFDIFTRTGTDNHRETAQGFFLRLLDKGHITRGTMQALYCPNDERFLPDRYVEGTCPRCGFTGARGDQCDNCGHPLDATELLNAKCRFCGHEPVVRETEHFFLQLGHFQKQLEDWVAEQSHWRPQVASFTRGFLEQGLQARAITRDIEWGVPIPVPGYDHKRIYVWFEACIGYLSSTIEWTTARGNPEGWKDWWSPPTKSYYFIGKDNIVFHTVIWPAMLMGSGDLNLPFDVPANEYLNLEGAKVSTSRNWAIWVPEFLQRYDPDPLRYMLAANMPETRDADFSWEEFRRRNNDELVASWGNLVHRTLTFTVRNFDGKVPEGGNEVTELVEARVAETFAAVRELLEGCHFKNALREIMALSQFGNKLLDERAPWRQIREDRLATADTLRGLLTLINALKVLTYPFLPFSSQTLHRLLGYSDDILRHGWIAERLEEGAALPDPVPLFKKIDE